MLQMSSLTSCRCSLFKQLTSNTYSRRLRRPAVLKEYGEVEQESVTEERRSVRTIGAMERNALTVDSLEVVSYSSIQVRHRGIAALTLVKVVLTDCPSLAWQLEIFPRQPYSSGMLALGTLCKVIHDAVVFFIS